MLPDSFETLDDPSSPALVAAVEENVVEWTRLKGPSPGSSSTTTATWSGPSRSFPAMAARWPARASRRRRRTGGSRRSSPIISGISAHALVGRAGLDAGRSRRPAPRRRPALPEPPLGDGLRPPRDADGVPPAVQARHRPDRGLLDLPPARAPLLRSGDHPEAPRPGRGDRWMVRREPRRAWHFVATLDGTPVAAPRCSSAPGWPASITWPRWTGRAAGGSARRSRWRRWSTPGTWGPGRHPPLLEGRRAGLPADRLRGGLQDEALVLLEGAADGAAAGGAVTPVTPTRSSPAACW